jgi:polyphosphate kinase
MTVKSLLTWSGAARSGAGCRIVNLDELSKADHNQLRKVFREQIFPVLTPLAVDPGHPFPYITNLSLNLAVVVRDPTRLEVRFAQVEVPPRLPSLIGLPDGERLVPLEDAIALHLPTLFPGMEIVSRHRFRVIRDLDLVLHDSEREESRTAGQGEFMQLRRRRSPAVRLDVDGDMSPDVLVLLLRELKLRPQDVHALTGTMDLTSPMPFEAADTNLLSATA